MGSTTSTTYTDSPGSGMHAYAVVAIDGAGNRSLSSTELFASVAVKSRSR